MERIYKISVVTGGGDWSKIIETTEEAAIAEAKRLARLPENISTMLYELNNGEIVRMIGAPY